MKENQSCADDTRQKKKMKYDDQGPDYSSKLDKEQLELILRRLPITDIIRFGAVCRLWQQQVVHHREDLRIPWHGNRPAAEIPWLVIPPISFEDLEDGVWRFINIQENKFHKKVGAALPKQLEGRARVGSSHGWLVLLDELPAHDMSLWLFNPLTGALFQLPPLRTLPFILEFKDNPDPDPDPLKRIIVTYDDQVFKKYEGDGGVYFKHIVLLGMGEVYVRFITKAILYGNPPGNFGVIVIYGKIPCRPDNDPKLYINMLAYWECGDRKWTQLGGKHKSYCDITCYNRTLYALSDDGCLEVWDFHKSSSPPQPIMYIDATSFPKQFISPWMERSHPLNCECRQSHACSFNHFYLVESSGHLLLVVRSFYLLHHPPEQDPEVEGNQLEGEGNQEDEDPEAEGNQLEGEGNQEDEDPDVELNGNQLVGEGNQEDEDPEVEGNQLEGEGNQEDEDPEVEGNGNQLVVEGNQEDEDREVEGNQLEGEGNQEDDYPVISTWAFQVYRMDFNLKKWIKVDSLGDRALFLGDNHALSLSVRDVPDFKQNSIYFTKDHIFYNCDDPPMSIFNLQTHTFEFIKQCRNFSIDKLGHAWIQPNPWSNSI